MDDLTSTLTSHNISFSTPSSPSFNTLRDSSQGIDSSRSPSLIVQPSTESQVAITVKHCSRLQLPVTILCGRHDLFGRFTAKDTVAIDVRALNRVTVAEDGASASVQGGATSLEVLQVLHPLGLHLPVGNCGHVGFTSWSTVGGMGALVNSCGFGADQILRVRYVDAKGEVVDAEEEGTLEMFRGGGIPFGVVVEMRVKVYPMEGLQVAQLAYESSDIRTTIRTFYTNYEALVSQHKVPSQLYIWPITMQPPGAPGLVQMCMFVWNGPCTDETRTWLDRVAALAQPTLPEGVTDVKTLLQPTTTFDLISQATAMVPPRRYGVPQSLTLSRFSPEAVDTLANVAASPPEGSQLAFNFHILHSGSPSVSPSSSATAAGGLPSVLPYREPRIVVELLPFATTEEVGERTTPWAREVRNRLAGTDASMKGVYMPLVSPEFVDVEGIYGRERWQRMRQAKRKHDPRGMFAETVPGINA